MINRRHSLGFIAAVTLVPSRAFSESTPVRELRENLLTYFAAEGTVGTFAALRTGDDRFIVSDDIRTKAAILPASTFKIPNSIIALETGVVADPDKDVFKWDGVTREIKEWNSDHTLRSAIAVSAVPVYQEIARRAFAAPACSTTAPACWSRHWP